MSEMIRVARRELAAFFSSLAAFIFIGVFLAASFFIVFWVERFFARNIADVRPLFEWMPILLIFLVSALTMRMWSEERRSGTLEFLMTLPVKPWRLVLGKSLACLALVALALLLTLVLPITVSLLGPLDWGPVLGGYIATLALAAAYISVGLFVSARTDSQIVSLIVTVLICGAFYLLGSEALTSLFGNAGGEILRLIGSGSRFESIARGVLDLRDFYYYLSLFGVFLVLNLYSLERLRWSQEGRADRHWRWRLAAGLLIANLIAANAWLGQISALRADLTEGRIYSISDATRSYLARLEEPLLIRGYFSAKTHPLLAPLAPRLRDLLAEYELAGGDRVRVEIVDPQQNPELEAEANRVYNIRPVPFQVNSKYQSSVTNSYFDILIKYGDSYEKLGYEDLIAIQRRSEADLDVELRDPEYEITRAIKKVLYSYRGSGDVFAGIPQPVRLEAYISDPAKLPDPLPQAKTDLEALIKEYETAGGDKFSAEIRDPGADPELAKTVQETYGLRPLTVGLLNPQTVWFHLVLRSGDRARAVALPATLDKAAFKTALDAEIKRFKPGALRSVALYTPPSTPQMPQLAMMGGAGPRFNTLEQALRENVLVEAADLKNGRVPDSSDILLVAAPDSLDEKQIFAIDQFLMKGGTVVVATSPFKTSLGQSLSVTKGNSGLSEWLSHNGLTVRETMVLDPQNAPLPIPVQRDIGGLTVQEIQLLSYPYFVDVRSDGLASEQAPTADLNRLTLSWASPITVDPEKSKGRSIVRLAESSDGSWTSESTQVAPDFQANPETGFAPQEERGRQLLAVMAEGRFSSFFAGKPSPLAAAPAEEENKAENTSDAAKKEETAPPVSGVIERSPESARVILVGSASFASDNVLSLAGMVGGRQSLEPLRFVQNVVDWSLEDRELLTLRSRGGRFSRTLLPLSADGQMMWEYLNYIVAALGLAALLGLRGYAQRRTRRRHFAMLGLQGS